MRPWSTGLTESREWRRGNLSRACAPLLAHPHVDPDRAALESERLPQSPLQKAAVPGFQEAAGEQDERRRSRGGLVANKIGLSPPAPAVAWRPLPP